MGPSLTIDNRELIIEKWKLLKNVTDEVTMPLTLVAIDYPLATALEGI